LSRRPAGARREPVEVTIDTLSHEGRGVGRLNGKAIFVHGALPGERVLARILRRRGRFDEAETVAVIEPSEARIEPTCPHFGICGGCSLQHMSEDHQLRHKQAVLLELLEHHAGCQPQKIAQPIRGPQWKYRRKARLGVKLVEAKGGIIVGFRERAKPYVTDCSTCDILDPRVGEYLPTLRALIQSLSIAGRIPQIEIALADDTAALIVRHLDPLGDDDRVALSKFAISEKFDIYLQSGGPETIVPLREFATPLVYRIDDIGMHFGPNDFIQVNAVVNEQLVTRALEYLQPQADDCVADLFCGIGNFSLPLARGTAEVIGIEGDRALIERAEYNARINRLTNCDFRTADLADPKTIAAMALGRTNKLLLDPPRSGAADLIEGLKFSSIERLVYVSCNPVTFARDCALLRQRHGYRLLECGILDMFPQTAHFESISLFVKA
jgi:23S rRNA (uracil1939-C5)-methyltransferase